LKALRTRGRSPADGATTIGAAAIGPTTRGDPVVLVGILLALTLVIMLPLALALVTSSGGADDAGVGSGAGELSAAALSALHRDLNTRRAASDVLPDPSEHLVPHLFTACLQTHERTAADRLRPEDTIRESNPPGPAPCGPGPDGMPLRF